MEREDHPWCLLVLLHGRCHGRRCHHGDQRQDLVINPTVYNSFVIVTLGSFGIAGAEKIFEKK
jgi:hypothetical protein